jgi:hypothetical protein
MTAKEKCRQLCWKITCYRDKWCQICGKSLGEPAHLEAHHIWFRSQEIWVVQYDPDFMVALDFDCHRLKEWAPHVDNELFIAKLMPRIIQIDADRANKVNKFLAAPEKSEEAKRSRDESPCFAEIAANLTIQLRHTMLQYELDMYNYDPPYRGRNNGN